MNTVKHEVETQYPVKGPTEYVKKHGGELATCATAVRQSRISATGQMRVLAWDASGKAYTSITAGITGMAGYPGHKPVTKMQWERAPYYDK
jgi:hypothetical protein